MYWAHNFYTETKYKHLIGYQVLAVLTMDYLVSVVMDISVVLMLRLCFMRVNHGYVDNNIVIA
jgi:hypothetical protein